jgi:hypothetical protein
MSGHNIPDEIAQKATTMTIIIGTSINNTVWPGQINMSTWEKKSANNQ